MRIKSFYRWLKDSFLDIIAVLFLLTFLILVMGITYWVWACAAGARVDCCG
jgi:hypothetical protein